MKHRRFSVKSVLLPAICLVCTILLFRNSVCAFAEENDPRPTHISYYDLVTNRSYAISNGYMLSSFSYSTEEYTWFPDTVALGMQGIDDGKKVDIATFSSSWVRLFANDQCFYIVESDYLNKAEDEQIRVSLGKVDPEQMTLTWLDSMSVEKGSIQQEELVRDILLVDQNLLLIYDHKIKSYNVEDQSVQEAYRSDFGIINKSDENHAIAYKGKLYIQKEDTGIYEIDLSTYEEKKLDHAKVFKRSIERKYTALYNYYVTNDALYYFIEGYVQNETASKNLLSGETKTILETPITFFAVDKNGAYFDIYDGGAARFYLSFSDNTITPFPINDFDLEKVLKEMVK